MTTIFSSWFSFDHFFSLSKFLRKSVLKLRGSLQQSSVHLQCHAFNSYGHTSKVWWWWWWSTVLEVMMTLLESMMMVNGARRGDEVVPRWKWVKCGRQKLARLLGRKLGRAREAREGNLFEAQTRAAHMRTHPGGEDLSPSPSPSPSPPHILFRRLQEGSLMSRRIQDGSLRGFRTSSNSLNGDNLEMIMTIKIKI